MGINVWNLKKNYHNGIMVNGLKQITTGAKIFYLNDTKYTINIKKLLMLTMETYLLYYFTLLNNRII